MEKISWLDKVTNVEVLGRVDEDRQILNFVWQKKHRWIGHVLRANCLRIANLAIYVIFKVITTESDMKTA